MNMKPFIILSTLLCLCSCATNQQGRAKNPNGYVTDKHGAAMYGTAIEYTNDIYMGRLSCGAQLELVDTFVLKNKHNRPIIKVKVLGDEGYGKSSTGKIGWINITDTSFVDWYDPVTKKLDPWRATLKNRKQTEIDAILKQKRLDK